MTKKSVLLIILWNIVSTFPLAAFSQDADGNKEYCPNSICSGPDGEKLYVTCERENSIAVLSGDKYHDITTIKLPASPNGIAVSQDGKVIFAACGAENGILYIVDSQSGEIRSSVPAGHTPMSPVLKPDGSAIYICSRYTNMVMKYTVSKDSLLVTDVVIPVVREPVSASITADGRYILVANHLPSGSATDAFIAAELSIIDTDTDSVATSIHLPVGSTSLKDVIVSPDNKFAYATHILARFTLPTTQLDRGWMNTNALSIIDIDNRKLLNTVLLDEADLGAANPWGVSCSLDGKVLCVSHSGTHEVSLIELDKLHARINDAAAGKRVTPVTDSSDDVPNDLSFLAGIRKRVSLNGNGPRAICFVQGRFYTAEYFSDTISSIDFNGNTGQVALNDNIVYSQIRKGEMYFHDANFCFQQWQSCASCHPGDGRVDGLNWDLLNDGIGNPKNTSSLLYSHQTPPAMVTGIRADAETAVRAGMKYIQFVTRSEEELQAIDEYLKNLQPVASPYLAEGKLSQAADRGKEVFEKAGCSHCHTGQHGTNMKQYDVGTGVGLDKGKKFDTPVLSELWRTAPYLNDGCAASIKEVLTKYNIDDKHGKTSQLSEQEIDDLVEFLLSF